MDIEIIGKTPISIVEVKERLHEIEKKKELNFRALKVFEYVNDITTKKKKEIDELIGSIKSLNIPRLNERVITKIADVLPENTEVLKAILTGEDVTLKQDDLDKIMNAIKK
jgi:DNA-directed RNA polymerase subunit F